MRLLFICHMMFYVLVSYAQSYEYQGIYYNIDRTTLEAEVTSHPDTKYEGVIHIPSQVFNNYTVTSIGENAFENCPNLWTVYIPNTVTIIKKHAFALSGISLEKVFIPQSVITIEDYAFYGCTSLKFIDLPYKLTSIGNYAFGDCSSLQTIYCYSKTPPETQEDTFTLTDISQIDLYVPEDSYDVYSSTIPWSNFKQRIPMPLTDIKTVTCESPSQKAQYTVGGIHYNQSHQIINIVVDSNGKTHKQINKPIK